MTVPSVAASISDLNSNFGGGYSLGNYYNTRWYGTNNSRGYLQSSGAISISDLMNRRNTSPASSGSATYYSSQNIPIPMFNNLTITTVSGQGGQGGFSGNCAGGGYGYNGGGSYLAGYVGSSEGPGGSPSGNWGSQASASTTLSINDSNQADIISRYGTAPYGGVGGGGGGGSTGYNTRSEVICTKYEWKRTCVWNGYQWVCADIYTCTSAYTAYYCDTAVGGGGGGSGGYIRLDWN